MATTKSMSVVVKDLAAWKVSCEIKMDRDIKDIPNDISEFIAWYNQHRRNIQSYGFISAKFITAFDELNKRRGKLFIFCGKQGDILHRQDLLHLCQTELGNAITAYQEKLTVNKDQDNYHKLEALLLKGSEFEREILRYDYETSWLKYLELLCDKIIMLVAISLTAFVVVSLFKPVG